MQNKNECKEGLDEPNKQQENNYFNKEVITNHLKEELLTIYEVAEYFKCHISTIRNWVDKGYLKRYGIGHRIYFKKAEIISSINPLLPNGRL